MPRDAYISIYGLGGLDGFCEGMNIASKIGLGRSFNGKLIFYSSLFQAGLDRVIVGEEVPQDLRRQIPQHRLHVLPTAGYELFYLSIQAYFENYLGADWHWKPDYQDVGRLRYFLIDLLASFHLGRPLLTTLRMPDIAPLQVTLPLEILSPVKTLFRAIKAYDSVVALPTLEVSKQHLTIVEEIMASSAYRDVEEQHADLLGRPSKTKSCLAQLEKANQALYWKWKDFLRMKSSLIRVAHNVPDVIEAIFGKAPSSVAKPIFEMFAKKLRKEHGLLIYDASPLLKDTMMSLMNQVASSPESDAKELERRIQTLKHERKKSA
jgi:hypothetical protein